jgi:hypothetical protein
MYRAPPRLDFELIWTAAPGLMTDDLTLSSAVQCSLYKPASFGEVLLLESSQSHKRHVFASKQ